MGRWWLRVLVLAIAPLVACAGLLDVQDVRYATDAGPEDAAISDASSEDITREDVTSDGAAATEAAPDGPPPLIACEQGPCPALNQTCCIVYTAGMQDTCVPGKAPSCVLDGSSDTTVMQCDDPSDCLPFQLPYCCLTDDDPVGGRFTSMCVAQSSSCAGAKQSLMCDPKTNPPLCNCTQFGRNQSYFVCVK